VSLVRVGSARSAVAVPWAIENVREQLAEAAASFDLVLLDSAPLRAGPMATRLWALADYVLCVFDAGTCSEADLQDWSHRIEDCSLPVRYVLNKVRYEPDLLFRD
jgi:hypothetical protein